MKDRNTTDLILAVLVAIGASILIALIWLPDRSANVTVHCSERPRCDYIVHLVSENQTTTTTSSTTSTISWATWKDLEDKAHTRWVDCLTNVKNGVVVCETIGRNCKCYQGDSLNPSPVYECYWKMDGKTECSCCKDCTIICTAGDSVTVK